MKDKDLPIDNNSHSLEELTDQANKIIESLENEKDLSNSVEKYQELLKLNKTIEKKFHRNLKDIAETTSKKVEKIIKKNEKKT
jgi:exonuclease VII small subunit